MEFQFKKENPDVEKRRQECENILAKNEDKVPVICEKFFWREQNVPDIDKTKFLVPYSLTVTQFTAMIKKRMVIPENKPKMTFFFLVNGLYHIEGEQTMGDIYKKYKDPEDHFLYITYRNQEGYIKETCQIN